ncbi:MAG: hypothetical protein ACYTG1_11535 [Planctomycetota bacterium]|jgi:hypothetical protein
MISSRTSSRSSESVRRRIGVRGRILCALLVPAVGGGGAAAGGEPERDPIVHAAWRTWTAGDGLPHEDVRAIRVLDDAVWVGTSGGLAVLDDTGWRGWTETDGLPGPVVTALDVDPRTGAVWLGTWGGGLARLSGGRFDRLDQLNSGLAGNLVFDLRVMGDRVWVATNGGLSVLDTATGTWDLHFERRDDTADTAIIGLAPDGDRLHAAAWCGGLQTLDATIGGWSPVSAPRPPGASAAATVDTTIAVAAARDSVWWVTQAHLLRRGPDGWSRLGIPLPPGAGGSVRCVAARDGRLVAVGTEVGLLVADWPTDTWVRHEPGRTGSSGRVTLGRGSGAIAVRRTATSLPDAAIRCVAFRGEEIWVGTRRGLARGTAGPRWSALEPEPSGGGGPDEGRAAVTDRADGAESVPTVLIGVLRPGNRLISLPAGETAGAEPRRSRLDRLAVGLAVEEANARGGYRGRIPFGIATGPDGSFRGWGWTTPEDDVQVLAARADVWGLVGSLGPGGSLSTAAILWSEIPVVNDAVHPAGPDERFNPWIFRAAARGPDRSFTDRYAARFRRPPPANAFASFEATRRLLAAIERAGLDRQAIRIVLEQVERRERADE